MDCTKVYKIDRIDVLISNYKDLETLKDMITKKDELKPSEILGYCIIKLTCLCFL